MNTTQCRRHKGQIGYPSPSDAGCQGCGCMLETKECQGCGDYFLDFSAKGSGDNIFRPPYFTSAGDLYCIACGKRCDSAEEQEARESGEDWF